MQDSIRRFAGRYAIYIIAFIAMLPAICLRDFTPDNELRYVSIAGEALSDGRLMAFTNHGVPYADKPPLYMWICMLGRLICGTRCLPFITLFSVVPAFIVTEILRRRCSPRLPGIWREAAPLMLLTSGLFLGLALTMRMDMLMTMFIVLALDTFSRIYRGDHSLRLRLLFPLWVFAALFTKGPYGILIPLAATLTFCACTHRMKVAKMVWGWRSWGIILLLCILWFGGVYLEGGADYLDNLLFRQTMGRAVKSFAHSEPFYYYGITIWYSLAPWTPAVIASICLMLSTRQSRQSLSATERFFLITPAVVFVLLSLFSAKLAVYLLPAFPYIIFAGAMGMAVRKSSRLIRWCIAVPAIIFMLLPFAWTIVMSRFPEYNLFPLRMACYLLFLGGAATLYLLFRKGGKESMAKAVCALSLSILAALFSAGFGLPAINPYIGYSDLAEKTLSLSETESTPVYTFKVRRPENLDVYLGREVSVIEESTEGTTPLPSSGLLLTRIKDIPEGVSPLATSGRFAILSLESIPDRSI